MQLDTENVHVQGKDFFFSLFKIEIELIYNILLVSSVQHSDSVIHLSLYIYSFLDSGKRFPKQDVQSKILKLNI